jgi:hypothetical protein
MLDTLHMQGHNPALPPQGAKFDRFSALCNDAPTNRLANLEQGVGATLDECHAADGWRLSKEEPDNSLGRMLDGQQRPRATNGIPPLLRLVQASGNLLIIQVRMPLGWYEHAYM